MGELLCYVNFTCVRTLAPGHTNKFQIYKQTVTFYKNCIEVKKERNTQREVGNFFSFSKMKAIKGSFPELVCDMLGWRVLTVLS